MNVILTQDVYKLGSLGDEVVVKAGYGRNYLIPQGFAVPVTRQNVKQIEHQRALLNKKREEAINAAKSLKAKLEALELVFKVKAGESGKLFGSVTQKNITEAIAEKGIELDKRLVTLLSPIKTLGNYDLVVKLHSEVSASMTVKVAADEVVKEPKEEAAEAPAEQADAGEGEE